MQKRKYPIPKGMTKHTVTVCSLRRQDTTKQQVDRDETMAAQMNMQKANSTVVESSNRTTITPFNL